MILVLPVSASDHELVPHVIKVMKKLGPNGNHSAVIVSTPTAIVAAQMLYDGIQGLFKSAEIKTLATEPQGGWPTACNTHFRETAHLIHNDPSTGNQPWYWFELDNTPLKRKWLDQLQEEYNIAGMPFMGKIHPTHFSAAPGEGDPPGYQQVGSHMVGTGIYPNDLATRSIMLRFLVEAFDVEMQYEIVPHCHDTNLIQHNWNTGNYRRYNGKMICTSFHTHRSPIDHAQPLDPEAVVLHGCKDGSLAEAIVRKRNVD